MAPGEQASGTGRAAVERIRIRARSCAASSAERSGGGGMRASLTLATVSERAGISVSMLSQVERGLLDPSLDTLRNIADALGTAPFRLLAEEGPVAGVVRRGERRERHGRGRRPPFRAAVAVCRKARSRSRSGSCSRASPGSATPRAHPGEEANLLLQGAAQPRDRRRVDRARRGRLRDLRSTLAASRDRNRRASRSSCSQSSARRRSDALRAACGDLRSAQAGAIMCDSQRISAWVKAGRLRGVWACVENHRAGRLGTRANGSAQSP